MPAAADVWYTAATELAKHPPCQFDDTFFSECYSMVKNYYNLDIHKDVHVDNCLELYLFLVNNVH